MDILKRQKASMEEKEEKLSSRWTRIQNSPQKEKNQQHVIRKRNQIQSIKGYNLSMRWKRHKYIIKRYWVCGKPDHSKDNCSFNFENLLIKWVIELEKKYKN